MPDLTSLLSVFLTQLYNGTWANSNITALQALAAGSSGAPSLAFSAEPTLGIWRQQAGIMVVQGSLTVSGTFTGNANVNCATTGGFLWGSTRNRMTAPADGQINFANLALTSGVGFDFSTDTVLKIRTRAQTGYATVDALGYSVSGVAGASKGAGAVTSITVVNGIVTACT